jgi:hypothetical protein
MQTKQRLHITLLRGILSVIFLLCTALSYASFIGVSCGVRGTLYVNMSKVSFFNRNDLCTVVEQSIVDNQIILWNNKQWVTISVPENLHGIYLLEYSWGSDYAYINNQSIRVEWGLVMRG